MSKKVHIIRKYLFLFFSLQSAVFSGYSQISVSGKITDEISGLPLQGAKIVLSKLNITSTSDNKGNYIISNIPTGEYLIGVFLIGYHDTSLTVNISHSPIVCNVSLTTEVVEMPSVIITATRSEKSAKDIPADIGIINKEFLQNLPSITADEYLSAIPGINITRHFGLFYKTGDVTMRGLNRNVHTLLLIDGIPLSIVDGGATNWNRIRPEKTEKIEVIKGANSSLYGSNAMGGVINIISKTPDKPFSGNAGVFFGKYNTTGGSINLNGNNKKNHKGFYWNFDAFMRLSDGYIIMPDSIRDSTDVSTYIREYNTSFRCGYSFNKDNNIETEYRLTDETRGIGRRIIEIDGNYDYNLDNFVQARYKGKYHNVKISAVAFFKSENYFNQRESMKPNGAYILFNTDSYSDDKGIWCNAAFTAAKKHNITVGFDSKLGLTNSSDVYHTSTDTIDYSGRMDFYGLFLQDDFRLLKDKIKVIAGIRYDAVNFYNGSLVIKEPSATTIYMLPYLRDYENKSWYALSPKAGILFDINKNSDTYISVSKGFRSSTLSDLCRTGDVNKGFKLANPLLKPEYINNIEWGTTWHYKKKLSAETVFFYSQGKNFQYFVGTGDSIYTTKTKQQPVIKRENIGIVEMCGAELGLNFICNKYLTLLGNYTFNHSIIKSFDAEGYISKNLSGKYITDVPQHLAFCGFIFKSKYANISITYKFKSTTWADDENTIKVSGYSVFDGKISHRFNKYVSLFITTENIFDAVYQDSKYLLSPGRFVLAALDVAF